VKHAGDTSVIDQTAKVVDALVRQWMSVVASPRELRAFRKALTNLANDLGLSPSELRTLAGKGDAADELYRLLEALRINSTSLAAIEPRLMLDLRRVCSMCDHKCECDCDNAAGILVKNYQRYCENADRIRSLQLNADLYVSS